MALDVYYDVYPCQSESTAPNLVLLHGWGMHSGVWDQLMPQLLPHFNVTVIDLPGMGRSPVANKPYTIDYLVDAVMSVAPDKAIFMGWSLGGMIALKITQQFASRVSALICVASTPRFTQLDDWTYAMPTKVMSGFQTYFAEDSEGTLIRFLSLQCKGSDSVKDDTRQLRELVFFHGLPATQALRGGLELLATVDLREQLKEITVPIQYVFGEKDNLVPIGVGADIKSLNKAITLAEIRGCSHLPFLTAADLYMQAIKDFLCSHDLL